MGPFKICNLVPVRRVSAPVPRLEPTCEDQDQHDACCVPSVVDVGGPCVVDEGNREQHSDQDTSEDSDNPLHEVTSRVVIVTPQFDPPRDCGEQAEHGKAEELHPWPGLDPKREAHDEHHAGRNHSSDPREDLLTVRTSGHRPRVPARGGFRIPSEAVRK